MFDTFGPLFLCALIIGLPLAAYVFRKKLRAFLKGNKKENEEEFRRLLVARAQTAKWQSSWPKVLEVYAIFSKLSEGQQNSSAALGGALKRSFVSLTRKEADTIARCFTRVVYSEVKRGMTEVRQTIADNKK